MTEGVIETASPPSRLKPIELYQMAIPHIIQSDSRVKKMVSHEKNKQRVQRVL